MCDERKKRKKYIGANKNHDTENSKNNSHNTANGNIREEQHRSKRGWSTIRIKTWNERYGEILKSHPILMRIYRMVYSPYPSIAESIFEKIIETAEKIRLKLKEREFWEEYKKEFNMERVGWLS